MQHLLQQQELQLIDEDGFANMFFLNIHCFDSDVDVHNKVLSLMLSTLGVEQNQSKQTSALKSYLQPCIPVSPQGIKLKLASELVDPSSFSNLFDEDDEMFPLICFERNRLIHQAMHDLGLISSNLPWNIVIASAKTIKPVFNKDDLKALNRIVLIIKSIDEKSCTMFLPQSTTEPAIDILKNIQFLPINQNTISYLGKENNMIY